MPNPMTEVDVVGTTIRFSELGLSSATVLASASPQALTAYRCGVPQTVLVLCRLSSGTVDVQVDVASSGTFGSSDASTGNVSDTVMRALAVDTSAANSYVNVRLVTSANCIVDRLLVLPLGKLQTGESWFGDVRDSLNAVAGTENVSASDGGGTFTFTASD